MSYIRRELNNQMENKMTTRKQRQQAEALLETTFVEVNDRNSWKVTDIDGKTLAVRPNKTHALLAAAQIEGKEAELLAIK